jgi:predicted dehydrogenase
MRKLRMGMVGGGKDAFIGAIHRHAAGLDGLIELVSGALSINPDIARDSAKSLFLPSTAPTSRTKKCSRRKWRLPEDQRIDFVTIVTPNFAHFAPAIAALGQRHSCGDRKANHVYAGRSKAVKTKSR